MVSTNLKSATVCIRVPEKMKERIDQDIVESGEFSSASQWQNDKKPYGHCRYDIARYFRTLCRSCIPLYRS